MIRNLLIIGGVAAGTKAAAKARREDPHLQITLLTDEEYITYAGCGLPYYIGGIVKKRDDLYVMTPVNFALRHKVRVLTRHRATSIDTRQRTVRVENLNTRSTQNVSYDKLLIATGAHPITPPVPGIDLPGVYTLRTIGDASRIKNWIAREKVKRAVIIGGGYIGLEMAENLVGLGISTTIIEMASRILPSYDEEVSTAVEEYLREKNVTIYTNTPVKGFSGKTCLEKVVVNGRELTANLAVVAIGVRPTVELAREAGITTGETGAIRVNPRMETSEECIYAAGDCAENINLLTGKPIWVPLGSTANKMGRTAAITITGGESSFEGILGTSIAKVFDWYFARTGLTNAEAAHNGIDVVSSTISAKDHAGYYPGARTVNIKLLTNKNSGILIGGQVYGPGSVDKTIDTIAAAVYFRSSADELSKIDLSYSPSTATALTNVITAAHVMEETLKKSRKETQ